ncbi:MAG TPA: tRNA (guanosine(37)-N1)-methyltransferase TrmD [bacterium]|nr:tRNA (guanosine(37)-N1)-methyltransferase TrmD [bacterium]HPR88408.1 tRNA (guanosine(37)-N1)-methyltransferase TrmD [bacterium]
MEIHIVAAFPGLLESPLGDSILKRAQARDLVHFYFHDIRAFATDKHQQIDDYGFGGGPGMILKPEPLFRCLEHVYTTYALDGVPVTLMSAAGELFTQKQAMIFSLREKMVLLCGHYKGIDERVIQSWVTEEISIGDYVLTGGEIAAMVIIDAVVRLLPGAISDIDSAETDSFQSGLLDHPHYTRPQNFQGMEVPPVLLSGNHAEIAKWRLQHALDRTLRLRPDLFEKYNQQD